MLVDHRGLISPPQGELAPWLQRRSERNRTLRLRFGSGIWVFRLGFDYAALSVPSSVSAADNLC
eukprot:2828357-Rhodomonas_salina.1